MKKSVYSFALVSALTIAFSGPALAECCKWKKVCKPKYKNKVVWKTCYDEYNNPYSCKKTIRVKVGEKCHNKCVVRKDYCGSDYDSGY